MPTYFTEKLMNALLEKSKNIPIILTHIYFIQQVDIELIYECVNKGGVRVLGVGHF